MISQKYPWTGLKFELLRLLTGGEDTPEEAARRAFSAVQRSARGEKVTETYINMMGAIARWLRDGKRIIHVSAQAQLVLEQALSYLVAEGHDPLRWRDVPNPGNYWHNKPVMFYFEPATIGTPEDPIELGPMVSFAQSTGELFDERVRFASWTMYSNSHDGVPLPGKYDMLWLPSMLSGLPPEITPKWWKDMAIPVQVFGRFGELVGGHTAEDMGLVHQVMLTMLCLTALASEERIPVLRKRQEGKRPSRRMRAGRVNMVNYDLDESGLFVWRKRYITDRTGSEPVSYPDGRSTPTMHRVRRHQVLKWVLPEHVKEGETVVEHKTREDGTLLCGVMRWRRASVRGEGLAEDHGRFRAGFDDLDTKK